MNINYLCIFLLSFVAVSSCDIVHEPYLETENTSDGNRRKVLLEEFTGHQCPNCPAGAATALKLQEFHRDDLIIISYHAGFYARTSSSFPVDYRTSEGSELDAFFNVPWYPSGMINRTSRNNTRLFGPVDWSEGIAAQIRENPEVALEITPSFDQSTRNFRTDIKIKLLSTSASALRLCVYLTEDSLFSPQSISGDPLHPSGFIQNYLHRHVFRTSLTGTWGEKVFDSGTAPMTEKSVSYSGVTDNRFIPGHCRWVAFVISETDKSVLQAETVSLLP